MYATSSQATGEIAVVTLEMKTEWQRLDAGARPLSPASVGMNVAEFEGQLPRFEEDPALLGAVAAESAASLHPDEPGVDRAAHRPTRDRRGGQGADR